jgi:hypothetical protein
MVCVEHSDDPVTTTFDQQLRIDVAALTMCATARDLNAMHHGVCCPAIAPQSYIYP